MRRSHILFIRKEGLFAEPIGSKPRPDVGGKTDQTQDNSVRSSTERFQSCKTATERVRWQVTEHW